MLLTAAVLAFASSAACAVDEDVPPTVATPPEVLPPVVPMIAPIPVCPYGESETSAERWMLVDFLDAAMQKCCIQEFVPTLWR